MSEYTREKQQIRTFYKNEDDDDDDDDDDGKELIYL